MEYTTLGFYTIEETQKSVKMEYTTPGFYTVEETQKLINGFAGFQPDTGMPGVKFF